MTEPARCSAHELEMLPTDLPIKSTWHRRQEEQNLALDIDAKESKSDFGDREGGDHSNEMVRASIYFIRR